MAFLKILASNWNKKNWLICCIVLSVLIISFFYGSKILHPNKFLFTKNDDGLKSYYNLAWQVKHSNSFTQLEGISYPYGESVLLEDCNPFFTSVLKAVSVVLPIVKEYPVAIFNIWLLFSFVLGISFLFMILKEFGIPNLLALFAANGIGFMSSQALLLSPPGHLNLSFICFFPIAWYFIIRYNQYTNPLKWSILIALNILVWNYSHVYLGLILLFFTFLNLVGQYIISFFKKSFQWRLLIDLIVQVLLPTALILLLAYLNNNHPDRIEMPFMDGFRASFYSVFMPAMSPLKPLYTSALYLSVQQSQSWCFVGNYIGLCSNLIIVIVIIYFAISLFQKRTKDFLNIIPLNSWMYVLSSIVVLLFSMAIPFRFLPQEIIDKIPLINQFSSFGRFAWAFYYVICVLSVVVLYKLFYKKVWGKVLVFAMVSLYLLEGSAYHLEVSKIAQQNINTFDKNNLNASEKLLNEISSNDFQAIMPVPCFFKFSVPFLTVNSDSSVYYTTLASYHSGIPIASTYLSRPSVSESLNIYQMYFSFPYRVFPKEVLNNKKNLAIVFCKADSTILTDNERELLSICSVYRQNNYISVLSLNIDSLHNWEQKENKLRDKNLPRLLPFNGIWAEDTNQFVYFDAFDTLATQSNLKNKQIFVGNKGDYNRVFKINSAPMDTSKEYTLSFWYYCYVWNQTFNTAIISERDSTDAIVHEYYYSPIDSRTIEGWWYFTENKFKVHPRTHNISLTFHGNSFFEQWYAVDDVMIRESEKDIYFTRDTLMYKNNKKFCILKQNKKTQRNKDTE